MSLIVHKYGGTSMGSTERISQVARRVAKWARTGHQMVVVPSAMSGETNRLLALAKELAPRRIRVNSIHPGPIANDFQRAVEADLGKIIHRDGGAFFDEQTPLGRHGTPQEIAQSVLYLASAQSSYTTGLMLMVDGGMGI